jgi:beta-glucosidase
MLAEIWNWMIPTALKTGKLTLSIPFFFHYSETLPSLVGTEDFFGINYYTRDTVQMELLPQFAVRFVTRSGSPRTDLDWEIYPKGLYRVLKEAHSRRSELPLLITENGIADRYDRQRVEFLKEHVVQLHRAIQEGTPVEGYCHWSLMDNFEWIEGFSPRFGLYEVDYSSQTRSLRASGKLFSDIARTNTLRGVTR